MSDKNLAPVCGLYCGTCEYFGEQCRGCGHQKGKPFWIVQMMVDICPLYDCCINRKQLEHCGFCNELPCKSFTELRDPSLSEEEAKEALCIRKNDLIFRRKIGTEKWIKDKEEKSN